jgi:hypothetical protein
MSAREFEPVAEPTPPAVAPVPAVAPAAMPARFASLARMGVGQRAAAMQALSCGAGNHSVARTLARASVGEEIVAHVQEYEYGIEIHLPDASTAEKLQEIQRLLGTGGEGAMGIHVVWESIPDLAAVAHANEALFLSCAKRDPTLLELGAFDGVRSKFKAAVEQRVLGNLSANRNYVSEQMDTVGVTADDDVAPSQGTAEQDAAVRNVQVLADQVGKWQEGMARALQIKVGRNTRRQGRLEFEREVDVDAMFVPNTPPTKKDPPAGRESEFRSYDEVQKHWEELDTGVRRVLADSPAVFAIVSNRPDAAPGQAASEFSKEDTKTARASLAEALTKVGKKIDAAVPLVGGSLDYRDFIPVHQQLLGGGEFAGEIERAVIQKDIEGHEMGKVLRSLGLGALSAAAFLVAEFATAGMATFIGVAIGVGASATNAGLSIADYVKKRDAAAANSGDKRNDIVSAEQVDSAAFQAVLDTALAFIDAAVGVASGVSKMGGSAAKLLEAAEAGAAKAGTAGLAEALSGADDAAKVLAIEKSLGEAGVEATMKTSGKSAEELAKILDPTLESEAAKRLLAAAGLGKDAKALEGLTASLADLAKLEPAERTTAMRQAIDQFGYTGALRRAGGWKNVTKTLGEANEISRELETWRSGLVRDLQTWMESASQAESKAVRTGTEKATSDVDISTLGADAAQQVERALEFVSQRAGVSRKELETILDLDAAVNPARMHLQDVVKGLSPQARSAIEREAAKFEEGLTYARRYHQAEKAGDKALMEQIEQEAGGRLNKAWEPLQPDQIAALQKRMDDWSAQLAKLEEMGGSEAEKTELIRKIGRTQAEVLASSDTMYGTGGSIRMWVTERPAAPGVKSDMEKLAEAGLLIDPAAKTIWPGQRFTAVLGEGHFLDKAFSRIASSSDPKVLVGAIKDFGKHGGRVVEILGRDVSVTGMSAAKMEELSKALAGWVTKSQGPLADAVRDAAELAEIRGQLAGQIAQLKGSMSNGISALRVQAQLGEALGAAELSGIDAWVRAEAAAQARGQMLLDHMLSLEQAFKAGVKAGAAATEPKQSAPEPALSAPAGE